MRNIGQTWRLRLPQKLMWRIEMIRMLWMALICTVLTGCVATTKVIIQHDFPDEHINYEIQQGWTKEY